MTPWSLAFLAATLVVLVAIPPLRRLALATDFVDVPGRRKVHRDPIPYLGGVALILGVMVGLLFQNRLDGRGTALVIGAVLLGSMGLIDDDRTVHPNLRLMAELAAAIMAVVIGIRIHASGSPPLDIALTIVWIVGVTNALNLLDNMDGLAGSVAFTTASAVFTLAVFRGQPVVATLAAATAGACLGYLFYNRPPASIFMGDAGSLFLGFFLAVLTIDVSPALAPPTSFVVPVTLLAVPILDTTTVTLARLRRRRPVSAGGKDHLSHRLVVKGLSRTAAVGVLVGAQIALSVIAVLMGQRVIPVLSGVIVSASVVGALAAYAVPVQVYKQEPRGLPGNIRKAAVALVVALPACAAPAVAAMLRSSAPAREAAAIAEEALRALQVGDSTATAADFERAHASFLTARQSLGGPFTSLGLLIPGLATNLSAARTLVDVGADLSETGARLASQADPSQLKVQGGSISLDRLREMAPILEEADVVLQNARHRLSGVEGELLVGSLSRAVEDLQQRLAKQEPSLRRAAQAARFLPAILGGEGTRRYFLAFQNNAELRGSGGLIGNWGELVAENGNLRLERFGRLQELNEAGPNPPPVALPESFVSQWRTFNALTFWQDVNVSPDFPTTANIISTLYPHSGGSKIDGVIAIDPTGLASLLKLTGPVRAEGWPDPITAENVVRVTQQDAYIRYPIEQDATRIQFLGNVARAVTQAFTTTDLGSPVNVAQALAEAVHGGHLRLHLQDPEEQQLVAALKADGAVPPLEGDALMIVNQNIAANKLDPYLHRKVQYDVRLQPGKSQADLRGRLSVTLENDVPAGLPSSIIGPYDNRFEAGENRSYLSVYSPFRTTQASVDGDPTDVKLAYDLGRRVHSTVVSMMPGQSSTYTAELRGKIDLSDEGWYRLDLLRQPTLNPDEVTVNVSVPKGWRLVDARGARVTATRTASATLQLDDSQTVWVKVERGRLAEAWHRMVRNG